MSTPSQQHSDLSPVTAEFRQLIADAHAAHLVPLRAVLGPLAMLLLYRREFENNVMKENLTGMHIMPPEALRWPTWCDLRGATLDEHLRKELIPVATERLEFEESGDDEAHDARYSDLEEPGDSGFPVFDRCHLFLLWLLAESPFRDRILDFAVQRSFETPAECQHLAELLTDCLSERTPVLRCDDRGEFAVPNSLASLMVDLLQLETGSRVYDPAAGTGDLLIACAQHLAPENTPAALAFSEGDPCAQAVCDLRVQLASGRLSGVRPLGIPCAPAPGGGPTSDRIVSVVPSENRTDEGRLFPIRSTRAENVFLQHIMASLAPGGRAVVAVSDGVLFRPGPDQALRERLLSEFFVEGVISLPQGALVPKTNRRMNLLVFARERPASEVKFVQAGKFPGEVVGRVDAEGRPFEDFEIVRVPLFVDVSSDTARTFRSEDSDDANVWKVSVSDLANRGWELIAKERGDKSLRRRLQQLRHADETIAIRTLGDVATVLPGTHFRREQTVVGKRHRLAGIPLIRVADIGSHSVIRRQICLRKDLETHVPIDKRTRDGDLVMTMQGTVGRVENFAKRAVGAAAAQGVAIVRAGPSVDPQYLLGVLRSSDVLSWLRGHARGSTVQKLSVSNLLKLPLPIPDSSTQRRIVNICEAHPDDTLPALLSLATRNDPLIAWLETTPHLQVIRRPPDPLSRERRLLILDRFADALVDPVTISPDSSRDREWATNWHRKMQLAAGWLRGVASTPEDAGRLALIQGSTSRLCQALACLPRSKSSDAAEEAARTLTEAAIRLADAEAADLLVDGTLDIFVGPDPTYAGEASEIEIHVVSESMLPLKNLSVTTDPDFGSIRMSYLDAKDNFTWTISTPPLPSGIHEVDAEWCAETMDGRPLKGESLMIISAYDEEELDGTTSLGSNPYITGGPVDRPEMLFGREGTIKRIQAHLATDHKANVLLLEGNRRAGKTSILKRLETPGILPRWIPVYCSLQGGEGHATKAGLPTSSVYRLIARDIGSAVHRTGITVWLPAWGPLNRASWFPGELVTALHSFIDEEHPFDSFQVYLEAVFEAIQPTRLLLMLDEFDKLKDGIAAGVTSPSVLDNIRYLLQRYQNLSAVLSGSKRLKNLPEEYWSALFGIGQHITVGALSDEDAERLVADPVDGRLHYEDAARKALVAQCARQPFLIQNLSAFIFDQAAERHQRAITRKLVIDAAQIVAQNNQHLAALWAYAGSPRRQFVLLLCIELRRAASRVDIPLLEEAMRDNGIPADDDLRLIGDLEFFRELDLIAMHNNAYTPALPLMARWVEQNVDREALRRQAVAEAEEELL